VHHFSKETPARYLRSDRFLCLDSQRLQFNVVVEMLLLGPLKDRGLGWLGAGAGSSSGGFSSSSGDEENLTKPFR